MFRRFGDLLTLLLENWKKINTSSKKGPASAQRISFSKFQNNFTAEFVLKNSLIFPPTISLKFVWHTYYIDKFQLKISKNLFTSTPVGLEGWAKRRLTLQTITGRDCL